MKQLTDLELTVLGIVRKKGPCTAYQIMQEFATSTATYYRSRAGSIYPLVSRLVRRRCLAARAAARGRQPARRYAIAPAGTAALRAWLGPDVPREDGALPVDLLRTRTYFLAAVPRARRVAFVRSALAAVKSRLAENQSALAEYRRRKDPFSTLAMEGALMVMRARVRWLERALRQVQKTTPGPAVRSQPKAHIELRYEFRKLFID